MSLTAGESRAIYQRILEEQPDCVDALDSLAQVEFRSGNPGAAAELLRRAIRLSPQSVHLYTNLAVTLAVQKQFDECISLFRQALALNPNSPEILMNLASALRDQGALKAAAETYRQLVTLQPGNAELYYNLGGVLKDTVDLEGAIGAYQQATALRPDFLQAHNDLANCLYLTRRFDQAIAHYQRTLALRPDYPEGHNNLSIALHAVGRLDEAAAAAGRAISLRPQFPEALYNLGRIFQDQQRFEESIDVYERALKLRPNYVEARNNLAGSLERIGRLEEAIAQYRQTVADKPDYREARGNLGVALKNNGRVDEAIETYEQILAEAPDDYVSHWNLGVVLLLKGEFERGWQAYEARRQIPSIVGIRDFPQPRWQGEALEGRRILLHAEQGFGDAIQFIRYAPLVRHCGGHVLVLCHPALRRLFENQLAIEQIVTDGQPLPAFDLHCPLLSLPGIFGSTLTTIPADVPYLISAPQLVQKWRERLSSLPAKFNVGIAWRGSHTHMRDRERSLTFAALAPLTRAPHVRFFNLQKIDPCQEAKSPPAGMELIDFTSELADFADTAGLIANLDLLICADTAVAHLAAALGKPVWVLLPFAPDWRWMLQRNDSPWYPTMRLFRQPRWGDWQRPTQQIAQELSIIAKPGAAGAQNDLGNRCYLERRFDEAINAYQRALSLRPDFPEGYNNLSICFYELGRMDESLAAARRAISLRPNYPEAHNNFANSLQRKGMLAEAVDEYRRVLTIRPDDLQAMGNLAVALESSGRLDEAIYVFEKLLAAKPDDHVSRFNFGIALLRNGDFERGWPAYEARRNISKGSHIRDFPQPRWTGEALEGKRILLHAEQGFGDAIQFIRYASLVQQRGGHVLVLCPPPLRRLFSGQNAIERVISDQEPLPEFDLHCPLLSLPGAFQTTLETIPSDVPYLEVDPQLIIRWRELLPRYDRNMKVGIAWAGRAAYERDAERSLTLKDFASLSRVPRVTFYSLQKERQTKDTAPRDIELVDYTHDLTDFAETAALISNLDLVIAADTAVAHLAGALAKPVWVLLPFVSDWRWMLERADSPWYPTMRLFRQPRWGDWGEPIRRIAEKVREMTNEC